MTKKQMLKLLERHRKHQLEANYLERLILNEVEKFNPESELICGCLACLPYSEPQNFAGAVMTEIGEYLK